MGLTNISAEMHADRQAREYRAGKARRPKTFRERYGDRVADQLLLVANAVENDLLPPFYQELGARQKGNSQRVLLLQREVHQSAEFFGVFPFKVTPSRVIALETLSLRVSPWLKLEWESSLSVSYPLMPPPCPWPEPLRTTTRNRRPMTSVVTLPLARCPLPTSNFFATKNGISLGIGWKHDPNFVGISLC
jgi:hypothetical protein